MCAPGCIEHVKARLAEDRLSRRGFFRGAGAVAAGAAALSVAPARADEARSFTRVVDLTHALRQDFPTFSGNPQLEFEVVTTFQKEGYFMYRWQLVEHTGTHMDAPLHFAEGGMSADQIAPDKLVVPLIVVDIKAKAAEDPVAQLTPDDLSAWEAEHGPIPPGACVAMNSGWAAKIADGAAFRGFQDGKFNFPGFHVEATQFLAEERDGAGIAVDTLSLDHGISPDFAVHHQWLPTGRWGLECIANLDELPSSGATLVVGHPKIAGSTGGPCRLIALV